MASGTSASEDNDVDVASRLIGVDVPADVPPDAARALRLLAEQSTRGIDYKSLGLGWDHPQARTEYRSGRHASFKTGRSEARSRESKQNLAKLVSSCQVADLQEQIVDTFVREIGLNRDSGPGAAATFQGVLAALEGELLLPLRAQSEGVEDMYQTFNGHSVPPKLVNACVAEIHTHVLRGDFSEWRYSNPVGARQLEGLSPEQIMKWAEPTRTEHDGGIVVHEDAPGELGLFWATKIGGPSHGFDVEGQCLLPLLANARHKVVLVSDPDWPHHPAGRAHFRLLWTSAKPPVPMLWLETVNCDFVAHVNPSPWRGLVLRHVLEKAEAMGVCLCLDSGMGRALQAVPGVDKDSVEQRTLQFELRPSNGVVEASDYLSGKHDWVQTKDEITDRMTRWVYTPRSASGSPRKEDSKKPRV